MEDLTKYRMALASMDKETFGKRFDYLYLNRWKAENKGQRGSMSALGKEIGKYLQDKEVVSGQIIKDWREGKHLPKQIKHFMAICKVLRVDPSYFSPDYAYLFPEYSEEQVKQIKAKCTELEIDDHILAFTLANYYLPHEYEEDLFDNIHAERSLAPSNDSFSSFTMKMGRRSYFLDEKDLEVVRELQDRIKEQTRDFLRGKEEEFERKYLHYIASIPVRLEPELATEEENQENFEALVQRLIDFLPLLKPEEVIEVCEEKQGFKYKR